MSSSSDDPPDYTIVAPRTSNETTNVVDRQGLGPDTLSLGRYRILRMMGRGGMGEVLVAHDQQVGRDVAIKRMRAANPNERQISRFLREASIQGRLEHPAIVPVHEIGRDEDNLPFFAMKRVSGTTLQKIILARPGEPDYQPIQRVLRAFAEVCLAVEFAHVRGIVHRDLKPDNIILGDFGEVYVIDWGVAKVIGEADGDFADIGSGSGEHATIAGTAVGTPGYMSPEQVRGQTIDHRADIYTLGCMLFEILAGEPLHPAGRPGLQSVLDGRDARPSVRAPDRAIPPELDAACVAATAIDADARIATARELGDRVLEYLDGDRDLARRRELAVAHLAKARRAFTSGEHGETDRVTKLDASDLVDDRPRSDDRARGEPAARRGRHARLQTRPGVEADLPDARRRIAMREASAALALDPALEGAAELLGRLMLEPPKETPREVEDAMLVDDVRQARDHARAGVWAIVATLAFTPLLWWIAPPASPHVAAFMAMLGVIGGLCVYANRSAIPRPGLVVIANTILIAFVARMFSPVLIAPGVAAVLGLAMVLTPRFSILGSPLAIIGLQSCAILVPLLLERVGVLSKTMFVDTNGILFHAPVLAGDSTPTIIVAALYAIGLVAGACAMANTMRTRAREAARHLHLQAWQMRQLVPTS